MPSISVDFHRFEKDLLQFKGEVRDEYNDFIIKYGQELWERILQKTPYVTGTLLNGWEYHIDYKRGFVEIWIDNDVEYASYVEYGTPSREGRFMIERSLDEILHMMDVELRKKK